MHAIILKTAEFNFDLQLFDMSYPYSQARFLSIVVICMTIEQVKQLYNSAPVVYEQVDSFNIIDLLLVTSLEVKDGNAWKILIDELKQIEWRT